MIPLYEWEYDTFECSWHSFKPRSDHSGKLGWEVINVQYVGQGDRCLVFLKRPKLFGVSVAKDV